MSQDFRSEESWRVFRILAEFVEGIEDLAGLGPAVTIFGSARTKPDHPHYAMAREVSKKLGESGFNIITGGGPGIMEAANLGGSEGPTKSIGIGIDLPREQGFNQYVEHGVEFRYFFVRKVMFLKYSDAIVVCPGGFGTMDEMFETITLIQTHKIPWKPIVLMGKQWFGGLLDFIQNTMLGETGYISPEDMDLFLVTDDPDEAVSFISSKYKAQVSGRYRLNMLEYDNEQKTHGES